MSGAGAGAATGRSRRIGGNLAWIAASTASERLLFFVSTIYLARVLGVASFGRFAAAQVTALSLWLVVDLGVSGYGVREIARDREGAPAIASALTGVRLLAGVLGLAIWAIVLALGAGRLGTPEWTALACGLYLVTNAPCCDWVLRGLERFRLLVAGSLASAAFFLAATVTVVRGPGDLVAAGVLWSAAALVASLVLIGVLRREGIVLKPSFAPRTWLRHLRESAFFSLAAGVMALHSYLAVLLLERGATGVALGLFAAPFRIVGSVGRAGILVQSAFFPALAETWVSDPQGFAAIQRRYTALMAGLGLIVAATGWVLSEPLAALLLGREYAGSGPVFALLLAAMGVRLPRIAYDGTLMAIGRHRLKTLLSVSGVVTLVAAFWLLPIADRARGMAAAVLLSEVVLLAVLAGAALVIVPRRGERVGA